MLYLNEITITNNGESDRYPFDLPLFKNGMNLKLDKSITFITGENGSGKSTLFESLASKIGFNTLGGGTDHYYSSDEVKDNLDLADNMRLSWKMKTNKGFFFRAESYFSFIKYVDNLAKDFGEYAYSPYGGKSLQNRSHGESFLELFKNRFNNGIFILDEPEAALSPEKQLALISIIHDLSANDDCQFIIATHSPILIACPDSDVFEIIDGEMIKKDYKETSQFVFYKNFIQSPERYLRYLFQ